MKTCSIDGCTGKHYGRTWCRKHYGRWHAHGDPEAAKRENYATPQEAFHARTARDGSCLVWTGALKENGYGAITVDGRGTYAHRWAWESANGSIPDGMQIDHTCWNRACVELSHLRLATGAENIRNLSGPMRTNSLGVRNVYKKRGRFHVSIMRDGQVYSAGPFHTLERAAREAQTLRDQLFGAFSGRG